MGEWLKTEARCLGVVTEPRRFPPPWSVDDPDMKLGQECFILRDADGHTAWGYSPYELESEPCVGGSGAKVKGVTGAGALTQAPEF